MRKFKIEKMCWGLEIIKEKNFKGFIRAGQLLGILPKTGKINTLNVCGVYRKSEYRRACLRHNYQYKLLPKQDQLRLKKSMSIDFSKLKNEGVS